MSKMTAKTAISILKGELANTKNTAATNKRLGQRLARAIGDSPKAEGEVHDAALARVTAAYTYALAALAVFQKQGKSALKEAVRLGISNPATPAPAPAPADEPEERDEPDYSDEDDEF